MDTDLAELEAQVRRRCTFPDGPLDPPDVVAAVDAAYAPDDRTARVAAVAWSVREARVVEEAVVDLPVEAAYEPGRFAVREAPLALGALRRLRTAYDVVLCDGHGLAHPRLCGLACHVGAALHLPTVGVAKNLLVGRHEPLPPERGARAPLRLDGPERAVVGYAVRTRTGVKPVYVSPGNLVGAEAAAELALLLAPAYRIPEPLRAADHLTRA